MLAVLCMFYHGSRIRALSPTDYADIRAAPCRKNPLPDARDDCTWKSRCRSSLNSSPQVCSKKRGKQASPASETPPLIRQLHSITERLDYLEAFIEDITPDGSSRVLDRMHELEEVTRKQCNHVLRIHQTQSAAIDTKHKSLESIVMKSEAKFTNMELSLQRRGDKERRETAALINELKTAIQAADQQASSVVADLDRKIEVLRGQIASLDVTVKDVSELCEMAEEAAANAQASARTVSVPSRKPYKDRVCFMTSKDLGSAAVSRARSIRDTSRERDTLERCIHIAQEAASRSPSRGRCRRTMSYDL